MGLALFLPLWMWTSRTSSLSEEHCPLRQGQEQATPTSEGPIDPYVTGGLFLIGDNYTNFAPAHDDNTDIDSSGRSKPDRSRHEGTQDLNRVHDLAPHDANRHGPDEPDGQHPPGPHHRGKGQAAREQAHPCPNRQHQGLYRPQNGLAEIDGAIKALQARRTAVSKEIAINKRRLKSLTEDKEDSPY